MTMTAAETRALLRALLREVLDDPAVDPQMDDGENDIAGFDSGRRIMLIMAVEERLAIRLRSREVDALRRWGDWVALIHRHCAAAS